MEKISETNKNFLKEYLKNDKNDRFIEMRSGSACSEEDFVNENCVTGNWVKVKKGHYLFINGIRLFQIENEWNEFKKKNTNKFTLLLLLNKKWNNNIFIKQIIATYLNENNKQFRFFNKYNINEFKYLTNKISQYCFVYLHSNICFESNRCLGQTKKNKQCKHKQYKLNCGCYLHKSGPFLKCLINKNLHFSENYKKITVDKIFNFNFN